MSRIFLILMLLSLPVQSTLVLADTPIEEHHFQTPQQEQRFRALIAQLRCPMCLNSNLAGSDAPIAKDLRAEIEKQINEGKSDDEIIGFMTQRYGNFINYKPPLNPGTYILWFGPPVLLLLAFFIVFRMSRANRFKPAPEELSEQEKQKINELLSEESESGS